MYNGPLDYKILHRYFAGHPISMVETAFFFIGVVALAMKGIEICGEYMVVDEVTLGERDRERPVEHAAHLLDRLSELSAAARNSWLGRRLKDALESIQRTGSADNVQEELKFLADADVGKQQDSYSLVRIVIWATPMLGFLGTVVGITEALGNLDPKQLATAPDVAFEGLKNGLYTAFDTTAVALSFSMLLMFIQYFEDRLESSLLATVDQHAADELAGRFERLGASSDPHVQTIERMSVAVVRATESLVQKQAEIWQQSLLAVSGQFKQNTLQAGDQLTAAVSAALGGVLAKHVEQLAQVEHKAAEHMQRRWEQWQTALSENARLLHAHQQELLKQSELMGQTVKAVGEVTSLEKTLNQNLGALAGSKNFEDTVLSLSAAINLLNSRLGKSEATHVELVKPTKGKAA